MRRQRLQKELEEKKKMLKNQDHLQDNLDETIRIAHLRSFQYQPLVDNVRLN